MKLINPCKECLVYPICRIRSVPYSYKLYGKVDHCEKYENYDGYRSVINGYLASLSKTHVRNKARKRQYLDEIKRLKVEYNEWYKHKHTPV